MDKGTLEKVSSLISALSNEADRNFHDPIHIHNLLNSTVNNLSLLLTHIGYLESRLENATAEIQRLTQISNY